MGLLSGIKNYIKTKILGITSDTTVKPADKKEVKTPVIQCENVGKNEDTVTVKNNENQISDDKKMNIGQKRQAIELKCKSNDINITRVVKRLIGDIGLTQEQFDALPTEKKLQILGAVEFAVDRIIAHKNKHGISKQINKEEIVSASAANVYKAVKEGNIESIEEFQKDIGDVNEELGKDFQKQDAKSRRKTFEDMAKRRSEQFELRLNEELKFIPKEQHEAYITKRRQYKNRVERARFHDILAVQDSESANLAIVTLNANDMAYGAKTVLKTRVNQEERTKAADMQTFEFFESNLKAYYERGEKADASVIEEFNEVSMSEKSYQAANAYQEDYKEARVRFENGEETPPYMSEEVFTSTAKGIGSGALNNVNMTIEEKAQFLATWENDAKNFSDYEVVTKTVKEEIAKNPEFAEKFEKAKQNIKQEKETKVQQATQKQEESINARATTCSNVNYATIPNNKIYKTKNKQVEVKKFEEKNTQKKNTPPKVDTKEVVAAIKKQSFEEASKKYPASGVANAVLNTPELKHYRPQIVGTIKTMSPEELAGIIKTTEGLLFVLRNISPEKALKLYEEYKQYMCHDAKVLGENIIEETNKEEKLA